MSNISLPVIAVWANVALLSLAGVVNLFGFRPVREIYADWDIPGVFYRAVGLLEIVAALFLATPDMRIWGIALAAPILFGSVVMLLNYRHYAVAAPVAAMMAALVVAILTVPPSHARPYTIEPATSAVMTADGGPNADDIQF
ncbi:MAG TPA: hypothetical protein VNH44_05780 [Micropepsaceae bacterium]|nr:hypothetical protein [Micropepsaceae bacterium]